MKAIKRTVAALLATLMLATSTSFTLAAENYTNEEAVVVAKVNAAGIMTGTDKGFEPSKSLTRAEAAAIIVRMKGISESAVKSMAGTTLFKDVAASHWASGYVNEASNLGIVKGVSATEFAPDREVTIAEFVTMAIRALGAGQLVDSEGTWPTNYVNFANENGILDDVNAIYTAVASRLQAATIVANTLEAPVWEKSGVKSNGEITWTKSTEIIYRDGTVEPAKTILGSVLNISVIDDVFAIAVDTKESQITLWHDTDEDGIQDSGETTSYDVDEDFELGSIKSGIVYDAWYNKNDKEIVGLWKAEDSKIKTVEFTKVKTINNDSLTLVVDGVEKVYNIVGASKYTFNDGNAVAANLTKAALNSAITTNGVVKEEVFGVATLDGNNIATLYAEAYTKHGVVKEVKSTKFEFDTTIEGTTAGLSTLTINNDDNEYLFTKNGTSIDVKDIKEDDAIAFYTTSINDGVRYTGEVITNTVEGEVTLVSAKYIKIDGTKYNLASTLVNVPSVEDEVEIFLNKNDEIFMWDKIAGAKSDVALVKYYRVKAAEYVGGAKTYTAKLFYMDGTTSDIMNIDLEETFDEMADINATDDIKEFVAVSTDSFNVNGAAGATSLTAGDKYYKVNSTNVYTTKELAGEALIAGLDFGKTICYEVTGGEIVVKSIEAPLTALDNEFVKVTGDGTTTSATLYAKSKSNVRINTTSAVSFYIDNESPAKSSRVFYLGDSTKLYRVKDGGDYDVKVEEIDLDELDDSTALKNDFYLIGLDEDFNVDYVVITDTVNRTSEANFAVVTKISSRAKYEGNTAKEVEVVYTDGKEDTLIWTAEDCAKSLPSVDTIIDIETKDGVLTDYDLLAGTATMFANTTEEDTLIQDNTVAYYIDKNYTSRKTVDLAVIDATGSKTVPVTGAKVSDDVLVLKYSSSSKTYAVKSLDDIAELDYTANKNQMITMVATYLEDDTDEEEIVAIIYVDKTTVDTANLFVNKLTELGYTATLSSGVVSITNGIAGAVAGDTKEFAGVTFTINAGLTAWEATIE